LATVLDKNHPNGVCNTVTRRMDENWEIQVQNWVLSVRIWPLVIK